MMRKDIVRTWDELQDWAEQYDHQDQYVFRGQGDALWPLSTSLARHFLKNKVPKVEWRPRELKMYEMFRERLLSICPGMYDDREPINILSLMQHHGTPTRLLDFTYSPLIAAYFALRNTGGNSAVWVIDTQLLSDQHESQDPEFHSGPTHIGGYQIADKYPGATVLRPTYYHLRLAAQRGCFLVPGKITKEVSSDLIHSQITLSESLVFESITRLRGLGIDEEFLFPDLDQIAREINKFSVTGSAEYPRIPNGTPIRWNEDVKTH